MSKKPASKKQRPAPKVAAKAKAKVKASPKPPRANKAKPKAPAKPAKRPAPKPAKATKKVPPPPPKKTSTSPTKKKPVIQSKPAPKPAAKRPALAPPPKPAAAPRPVSQQPAPSTKTVKTPTPKPIASQTTKSPVARSATTAAARKGDRSAPKIASAPRVAFSLEEALELAKSVGGKAAAPAAATPPETTPLAPVIKPAKRKLAADEPVKIEARKLGAASLADILGFDPQGGLDPEKAEAKTIPEKWQRYYKLLVELRRHIKEGLMLHSEETLMKSAKEDAGDLSGYSQHMADSGTDTFDRDFALSVVANEQEALNEIEGAIKRMQLGTYGVCELTEKPISKERLLAVPFARYSVESQAEVERIRRQRAARGLGMLEFDDEEGGPTPANGGGGDDDGED